MPQILQEFSLKLMNNILVSSSQEEVERHIHSIKKSLEEMHVNNHIILEFFDNVIVRLKSLSPMNKNAQEWSNIQAARIFIQRTKNKISILQ